MTDESLIFDIDIIEKEHEKEIERVRAEVTAAVTAKKDAEIEALKTQLAELRGVDLQL